MTLTPVANFEVIAQESNKTPAQIAQEFNAFQKLLQTYDAGRQLFPDLPQHTENNNASPRQYATSSAGSAPATPLHRAHFHGRTPNATPAHQLRRNWHAVLYPRRRHDPVPTGTPTPVIDTRPRSSVTVAVPTTPLPFVVTPPHDLADLRAGGDHFGPVMSADGQYIVYDPDGIIYLYDRADQHHDQGRNARRRLHL